MKRTILVLITVFLSFSVFAGSKDTYKPTLGVNSRELNYSLYENAANLSEKKVLVSFPSVNVSVNHLAYVLSNYGDKIEAYIKNSKDKPGTGDLLDYAYEFIKNFPVECTKFMGLGVTAGAQINNFAFGLNADFNTDMYLDSLDPQFYNLALIPYLDASLSLGYGNYIYKSNKVSLSAGVVLHLKAKAISQKIGAAKAAEIADAVDSAEDDKKAHELFKALRECSGDAGFAVSPDLGFSLKIINDNVGFDFLISNFTGKYFMWHFASVNDLFAFKSDADADDIMTPVSYSAYAWVKPIPNSSWLNCTIKAGFSDISKETKKLKEVIDLQLILEVKNFLDVYFQNKSGYGLFGVGLNVYGNMLDLSYGWHEEGDYLGALPVDSLQIKFTLGYGK